MFSSDISGAAPFPVSPRLSVLIVEDSDSDADIIHHMIDEAWEESPARVTEVPRLSQAFACLRHRKFDMIVADINLLDMSGPIVISALHEEAPGVPIVAYSGLADKEFQDKILNCGAVHYLVKGYESPQVLKEIFLKNLKPTSHA
jgi:two-component system sensor histidine kinase/response regulator